MTGATMTLEAIPMRARLAIYGAGIFSNSSNTIVGVVLPLWLLQLEASPFVIGLALGSRFFLSTVLAIHGGAMMDKLGVRRVMIVLSVIGLIAPPLHPVLPYVWAILLLQMLAGFSASMGWVAGQTLVGQLTKGSHGEAGRLAASHRVGSLVAAPVAGIVWDLFGPWGGFALMGLWGAGLTVSAFLMPDLKPQGPVGQPVRVADVVPRWADYRDTLMLMRIPALATVIAISMLGISAAAIQTSFLVVYMDKIGLSGTLIGSVAAVGSILAGVGALLVGRLTDRLNAYWLLLGAVILEIVAMFITPWLTIFPTLMAAAAVRGLCQGVAQPLMISAASRATDGGSQGKSVGLRTTVNRFMFGAMPLLMGAVVQWVGLEDSFFVICGAITVMLAGIGIYMARAPWFVKD